MKRIALLSALLLAGCNPPAQPGANETALANGAAGIDEAEPAAVQHLPDNAPLPAGGMREWLVGLWAFGDSCDSGFTVQYDADGKVDNSGELGTWTFEGGKITETITETFAMGDEAPKKVDPPKTRSFPVERTDQNHGVVTSPFNGKKVPILRC